VGLLNSNFFFSILPARADFGKSGRPYFPLLWAFFVCSLLPLLWAGLNQEVMEVDSAQYASMSREMLVGASPTELTEHGRRYESRGYPDKPPLVFWAGALGMRILGSNEAGFRLISWLAAALALWAVGKWARLLVGRAAVAPTRWIYACNLGMLLMNVDLRTDSLLLSMTSIALWQGQVFLMTRRLIPLLGFTLALAMGLMAKGPVAAVAVVAALLPALPAALFARPPLHPRPGRPLPGIPLIPAIMIVVMGVFLLLTPMLLGLYRQWGWHDGVRYFIWTQSFGRITGENPWANQPGPFFLSGSLAWSFLPWTPVLLVALVRAIVGALRDRWRYPLLGPLAGLVLLTVALSSSAYQLPHYVYIVWPFASVLCGDYLSRNPIPQGMKIFLYIVLILIIISCLLLCLSISPHPYPTVVAGLLWMATALWLIRMSLSRSQQLIAHAVTGFLAVAATLLLVFYPNVLPLQSGARAGQYYRQNAFQDPLWILGCRDESLHNLHFYARQIVSGAEHPRQLPQEALWIYTDEQGRGMLQQSGRVTDTLIPYPFLRVSTLNAAFFDPNKRAAQVDKRYLIHIRPIFAPNQP